MEDYYTEKERHIHKFLLTKGWTDEEINKSMFNLTKWTTVMTMSIEAYYELVMEKRGYSEYKKYIDEIDPEEFLLFKRWRRRLNFMFIVSLAFIALLIFTWIKGGG